MIVNQRLLLQVIMPAVVIGMVLLGSCWLGIRSINHLQANRAVLLSRHVESLRATLELEVQLRQVRFHSFLRVMDPSPARLATIDRDLLGVERALGEARLAVHEPEEVALLDQIEAEYRRYQTEIDRPAFGPGKLPSVEDLVQWADAHPVQHLLVQCNELIRCIRTAIDRLAEESEDVASQTRMMLSLLGVLGPISGLVAGAGVAWGLSRSIARLSLRLQDVHADLEREVGSVRLTAGGDLRVLDRQLDQVVQRVRLVIEESQQQQQDMLRAEQLSAVGHLAASVAHEVRNPLMVIKLLVGAALAGQPSKSLTLEDLHIIHEEIGRLERKVQTLLDFARPPETRREPSDLRGVLARALELVQARVRQQGITLEQSIPEIPVILDLDQDQFAGVLVNLLLNALDAMPRGGRLQVRLQPLPAEARVRLDIGDTGPGLTPEVMARLFTPFTSNKPTGTGLGLSICRRVVQDHGGQLGGSNQAEGGALFTITLPWKAKDSGHADVAPRG